MTFPIRGADKQTKQVNILIFLRKRKKNGEIKQFTHCGCKNIGKMWQFNAKAARDSF